LLSFSLHTMTAANISSLSLHDALPISIRIRTRSASLETRRRTERTVAFHFDPEGRLAAVLHRRGKLGPDAVPRRDDLQDRNGMRSEEHTSELQSPDHLVCRHLLEKKKQ